MNRELKHVLLVDDEPEICVLLCAMLKRAGTQCTFAHNVRDGRHALERMPPFDAAFIDANLPDGSGYSLIPAIKDRWPEAACVAVSAIDTEGANAKTAGADAFVPKPFNREAIMAALRNLGFNT